MNGCDIDNTAEGTTKEAERARKIYRYVSDTARRIDEATPACKITSDLFTTYMEGLRQKIRDNCEKLMFLDPLAYGRKALELLWRKAYYDTVSLSKKFKVADDNNDNYIFTHLACGIGHYHHLIARILTEMDVKITHLDYPPMPYDDDENKGKIEVDDDVRQWGAGIIHSCLIYLGDLSRYQSEMFESYDPSISARYYLQAASLDLSSGMPYNQLGNLYTDRNHNLDSVCYYIHCLSCSVPFEGAEGNLTRLFEKNVQYIETLDSTVVEVLEGADRVRLVIGRILCLAESWFSGKENADIDQLCSQTVQDLKLCFTYEEPKLPDITRNYKEFTEINDAELLYPSYLNPNIIFQIVQICLFSIHKLNDNDQSKAFAVKAFTLALYSQVLQKFLDQMHQFGFQNPSRRRPLVFKENDEDIGDKKLTVEIENNKTVSESIAKDSKTNGMSPEKDDEIINVNGKINGKKSSAKRRRRRRIDDSESSEDSENEEISTESELSSNEDDSTSHSDDTYYSEDSNYEHMGDEDKPNNLGEKKTHKKFITENNDVPVNNNCSALSKDVLSLDDVKIQNFLRGNNFLPSLKLLQDWVLTEPDLILSCGESGDIMFQCTVDLLNILQANFTNKSRNKKRMPSCKILDFARRISAKWEQEFKEIPLPEDVNLRGTEICKFEKDATEWELLSKYSPTIYEENIIRILNCVHFGHQIAKIVTRIRYNKSMQVFFLKKNSKHVGKVVHKDVKKKPQRVQQKSSRQDTSLMRSLGRLWLQSQVRELESAVRGGGGGGGAPPAFLVVDAAALTAHTRLVKQLVRARKFVVLVPTVVLQSIDELKKEVGGARDAIRWLESQLQSGSRFLRTQRPNESKPLPLIKYPRKAPKQVHQFVQIIEFCHHFVANEVEIGDGDSDKPSEKKGHTMLVLLTGTKVSEVLEEQKDFSYTGVAQSAGVTIDNIVHFTTKWRHLVSKPGNKR